jgi:hypothetical protein
MTSQAESSGSMFPQWKARTLVGAIAVVSINVTPLLAARLLTAQSYLGCCSEKQENSFSNWADPAGARWQESQRHLVQHLNNSLITWSQRRASC